MVTGTPIFHPEDHKEKLADTDVALGAGGGE
jgi:hypothetical protein